MSFGSLPGGSFVQRRLIPRHDPAAKKPKILILSCPSPFWEGFILHKCLHHDLSTKWLQVPFTRVSWGKSGYCSGTPLLSGTDPGLQPYKHWPSMTSVAPSKHPGHGRTKLTQLGDQLIFLIHIYIFFRSACRQPGKWICIEHAISGSIESWLQPKLGGYDSVW